MKKTHFTRLCLFSLTCALLISACNSRPNDVIPKIQDTNIKEYLLREYDTNGDKKLSPDEVDLITELVFYYAEDTLGGLKYLTSLRKIAINNLDFQIINLKGLNSLASIELTNMKGLSRVILPKSNIQEINITRTGVKEFKTGKMPFIHTLTLIESPITEFETGKCESLTKLNLNDIKISHIDLSKYPRLENLFISNTNVRELDVSCLPHLKTLIAKGVKTIIVGENQKLRGVTYARDNYAIDEETIVKKK